MIAGFYIEGRDDLIELAVKLCVEEKKMKFKFPNIGFNRSLGIDLGTANTLVYSKNIEE